jgi:sugar transferase EpsL
VTPGTYKRVKRFIDVTLSSLALLATSPVQLLVALAVRLRMGKPVLFKQTRPGLDGQPFEILKFRTMLQPDPDAGLLSDADRLTPLGRALRATSLDELPSLWNVLRGDMSVVGPRPLRMHYLPHYTARQSLRHRVRPGLTGLAQVEGRNSLPWEARLELDAQYVERMSLMLDLKIVARTIPMVLGRKGISAEGHATMSPFIGNSNT